MNIYLKNIGIVKDSNIAINGLTVIAGKNNSGKTTVGKVLYSLIDAVSNLRMKVASDRKSYISNQINNVESSLELLGLFMRRVFRYDESKKWKKTALYQLLSDHRRTFDDIEKFAHKLYEELKEFNYDEVIVPEEVTHYYKMFMRNEESDKDSLKDSLRKQIESAISILESTFMNMDKDPEYVQYARESIEQTLLVEFSDQIQPIARPEEESKIVLDDDENICFSLRIKNNQILNDGNRVFYMSPCNKTYLIDDPFILNDSPSIRNRRMRASEYAEMASILNKNRVLTHNEKLRQVIRLHNAPTILEKTILDESLKPIKEKIDSVLPGQFEFTQEGSFYVQGGIKLNVSNLATGSKMFSLIKVLLDKGELNSNTLLVLDEPEAHLHPMWQNVFAETIVLIAKELNVRILLTTHSPNFMLAIDAYMRKHNFIEKTNFYQTESDADGFVTYNCVNDNMELIYGDFLRYLSDVKRLRDSYLYGTGEE